MHTETVFGSVPMFESSDFDFVHPDLASVFVESIPLSQNALEQHTSKLEANLVIPSPLFRDFSLSPVPSSITTSSTSDDTSSDYFLPLQPPSKRHKSNSTSKSLSIGSIAKPVSPNFSLKPTIAVRHTNSRQQLSQPRRYRPILPAPPRPQNQPSGPSIQPRPVVTPSVQKTNQASKIKSEVAPFRHTPTNLPPVCYPKGQDTPFRSEKLQGTIPGSLLETLPLLEARFDRLEAALEKYAQSRYQLSLKNSLIEGLDPEY